MNEFSQCSITSPDVLAMFENWAQKPRGTLVARRYEPSWAVSARDAIDAVRTSSGLSPNAIARGNARLILEHLSAARRQPGRVIASGEGGVAFVFEAKGRYADIECLNDGSVLIGLTDFADEQEVLELDLEKPDSMPAALKRIERFLERE